MTNNEIRNIIISCIVEIAPGTDVSSINDSTSLRDQLSLDSMDFLDLVMDLRKHYQIEIPQKDFPQIKSMNDFIDYLRPKFDQLAA